jgi:hypothetical protein
LIFIALFFVGIESKILSHSNAPCLPAANCSKHLQFMQQEGSQEI